MTEDSPERTDDAPVMHSGGLPMNRDYRFVDPDNIDTSNVGYIEGTNAQCLADAMLDILQVGLATGMTQKDVDESLRIVQDTLADSTRASFKLHVRKDE